MLTPPLRPGTRPMPLDRRRFLLCTAAALGAGRAEAAAPALVFAAASLGEALTAAAEAVPDTPLTLAFAGSATLARQIDHGAPAALFVSADLAWMDYLDDRGALMPGTRRVIAGNRLVLIAPRGDSLPAATVLGADTPLATMLGTGRLAIALTDAVPAGRYARAALETLGLWDSVAPRLAQTDNVRAALALVARGEAPYGIVYASDAAAEPRVAAIATVPAATHPPIRYPAALLATGPADARPAAAAFLAFLSGAEGQAILAAYGLGPRA